MRLIKAYILLYFCLVILAGCDINSNNDGGLQDMRFGKNITIDIADNETIDAEHLQKVLEGKYKIETPYFDLMDQEELAKMVEYMRQNDYITAPGKYILNQAWSFEDGVFILNNGEKRKIFEFQPKGH